MIHMSPNKTKNPEWEAITIAANQNFFVRSVVMAVVSQILLGLFSVLMFYVFAFVIAGVSASGNSNANTTAITFSLNLVLFLLVLGVANLVFFVYNLVKISDLHKKATAVEDAILEDQE